MVRGGFCSVGTTWVALSAHLIGLFPISRATAWKKSIPSSFSKTILPFIPFSPFYLLFLASLPHPVLSKMCLKKVRFKKPLSQRNKITRPVNRVKNVFSFIPMGPRIKIKRGKYSISTPFYLLFSKSINVRAFTHFRARSCSFISTKCRRMQRRTT